MIRTAVSFFQIQILALQDFHMRSVCRIRRCVIASKGSGAVRKWNCPIRPSVANRRSSDRRQWRIRVLYVVTESTLKFRDHARRRPRVQKRDACGALERQRHGIFMHIVSHQVSGILNG